MDLKPGSRWKSSVCETELVIVRPPRTSVVLECGGAPVIPFDATRQKTVVIAPQEELRTLVGKRFSDSETGLEVLCTKSGAGSISIGGRAVAAKEAKKLPSSD